MSFWDNNLLINKKMGTREKGVFHIGRSRLLEKERKKKVVESGFIVQTLLMRIPMFLRRTEEMKLESC